MAWDSVEQQQQAEVVGVLHTLTGPIRMMLSLIQWGGLLAAVFMLFLANQAGWIIGIGSRGAFGQRFDINRPLDDTPKDQILTIDYRTVDLAGNSIDKWADTPWVERHGEHYVGDMREGCATVDERERDPRMAAKFDESPATWDADAKTGEENGVLIRKAARFNKDIEDANVMVSSLRYALARMSFEATATPAELKVIGNSQPFLDICDAAHENPFDGDSVSGKRSMARWYKIYNSIVIPDAPVVLVNHPGQARSICLLSDVDYGWEALKFHANLYSDLFAQNPPITRTQRRAEKALRATATLAFWQKTALANHLLISDSYMMLPLNLAREVRANRVHGNAPVGGWEDGTTAHGLVP